MSAIQIEGHMLDNPSVYIVVVDNTAPRGEYTIIVMNMKPGSDFYLRLETGARAEHLLFQ